MIYQIILPFLLERSEVDGLRQLNRNLHAVSEVLGGMSPHARQRAACELRRIASYLFTLLSPTASTVALIGYLVLGETKVRMDLIGWPSFVGKVMMTSGSHYDIR